MAPSKLRLRPVGRAVTSTAPAVVILLVGAIVFDGTRRTRDAERLVAHAHELTETTRGVLTRCVDAETGQRGFLLTGRELYLDPYVTAERDVATQIARLRELAEGSPDQLARIDSLTAVTNAKFVELAQTIALRRAGARDSALRVVEIGRGRALMDDARQLIAGIESTEQRLLAERRASSERYARLTISVVVFGALLAALFALLTNMMLARAASAEARAARELDDANVQLQDQAAELEVTNHQLQEQATELEMTNQQLQEQATELEAQQIQLEQQVREAETLGRNLQAANSELVAATTAAQTANKTKTDFLATMSHELRTPLNAIGGYAELMEMGIHGPVTSAQREDLGRIKRSNQHLLSLINDILNFSRLDAGRVELRVADVRVARLFEDVETLVAPQLDAKGLSYSQALCGDEVVVRADPEKLRQIVLNLLTNALKFTDAGGRISLGCRMEPGIVCIIVADTGRGIVAGQLERIFEPFVQVERHLTSTSQQGIGLGLAISRDLARGMGGEITVESVRGVGSTFTLTLPAGGNGAPR